MILFVCAGRFDWLRGWIYLGANFGCVTAAGMLMAIANPQLLNERGKRHSNDEPFEKWFAVMYVLLLIALYVVAGLDAVRFGWSQTPAAIASAVALLLFVSAEAVILWCMRVNPFLETSVRIQSERSQRVIDFGPYRLVRHPMYGGLILQYLAAPLMLGSRWALIPGGLVAVLFAWRASMEDRVLRRKLAGYAEYTRVTRYLLAPGIW